MRSEGLRLDTLATRRFKAMSPADACYFFTFFLFGGDPAWQVPQGLPFAKAGVAWARCVSKNGSVRDKNTPTAMATIATFIEAA
jgi:hypothetical protein